MDIIQCRWASLLATNHDLCEKIALTGLSIINTHAFDQKSALMHLLEDRETRSLFEEIEHLNGFITEKINERHETANKDLLYILTFAPHLMPTVIERGIQA